MPGKSRPRFLAMLVLPMFGLAACEDEPEVAAKTVRPVFAVKVCDATQLKRRQFPGRAKATREVVLSFRVGGQLSQFDVNIGDTFSEGDLVARLDPAPFEAERKAIAAKLQGTSATLTNSRQQFDRDKILFEKGHVAAARLDIRTGEVKEAEAQVAAAKAQLERANLDLRYTKMTAPFDGVVVTTFAERFEDVRAQQTIVRLIDNSRIEMVVDVPENLISLVPQVKNVNVVFDAFPDLTYMAAIKEIGSEASETTRTFPVTLIMDQLADVQILPGMAGKATAAPGEVVVQQQSRIQIPLTATFTDVDGGTTFVWVVDEVSKKVARREIETAQLSNQGVEIASGITPGEWVVTAGVNSLKEGQTVRIIER